MLENRCVSVDGLESDTVYFEIHDRKLDEYIKASFSNVVDAY